MKAVAVKKRGTVDSLHFWAIDVTLDDGTTFTLQMPAHHYDQVLRSHVHCHEDDEPDHDSPLMAALLGRIAGRIDD